MRGGVAAALVIVVLVVAELVLGVLLVVTGARDDVVNPYRVGDGFPQPPPCSMISDELVVRLAGATAKRTDSIRLEDDDPVRTCAFKGTPPALGEVEVIMHSRLVGPNGPLEVHALGLSELRMTDNLSTKEHKRYYFDVAVRFEIDNLDAFVLFRGFTKGMADPPDPAYAKRVRDDTNALARDIAGKLEPRNKTGPTLPSIVPTRR